MALLWADPFDWLGTSLSTGNCNTMLTQFGYSTVLGPFGLATGAAARTGPLALRLTGGSGTLKRTFAAAANVIGIGCGLYNISAVGYNNVINSGLAGESAGGTTEFLVKYNASNGFDIYDRTGALKGSTPNNVAFLNTWYWVEVKARNNADTGTLGTIELRINGVTQALITGVNLPNQFAIVRWGGNSGDANYDDLIAWDNSGTSNNDFLGDRRLIWSVPNAATASADFTANPAGTPFDRVNDSPPTGAPTDTAWIEGAAAGNVSEFARTSINIAGNDVAAIVLVGRLAKSDAGACSAKLGINSNGFVSNSPDMNPGVSFGYGQYIIEKDPNGNIQWTRAAVDAALSRITRSA